MALIGTHLAISTAALAAEGHFDRTLPVSGPVQLIIRSGVGGVKVRAGGEFTVRVRGTIQARGGFFSSNETGEKVQYLETHPPIEQNGSIITVGAITDANLQRNISIDYELTVPAATRLKSQTGSGDQKIDGISGPLEASAGSGSIHASNIDGDVQTSTGSGEIDLESVKGNARVSTGSGDIRAIGVAGGFRASTGSGGVTLEQIQQADARIETASGDIEIKDARGFVHAKSASGSIKVEGEGRSLWSLETVSGNVTARLPQEVGFSLRWYTLTGNISTKRPLLLEGRSNQREVTGTVGSGELPLDIRTVTGNIEIF